MSNHSAAERGGTLWLLLGFMPDEFFTIEPMKSQLDLWHAQRARLQVLLIGQRRSHSLPEFYLGAVDTDCSLDSLRLRTEYSSTRLTPRHSF